MYSNLLEHVKEYSDFYFPFLFGLLFPITISKIYHCNRKREVNNIECQDKFFQEMNWSIFEFWYFLAWIWKCKSEREKVKTYENSTTLLILWNSSGGWGCNNFNNASNAHWQNSSASKALLNGLVQFPQCVLTRIYMSKSFFFNQACVVCWM